MHTNKTRILEVTLGAAVLSLLSATAWADHFKPLSPHHTSYGVAQLNYGNAPHDLQIPLKLMNPNHVTQVAATFVYQSDRSFEPLPPEVYRNCVVRVVTPHGSISVFEDDFYPLDESGFVDNIAAFIEVIWAPVDKVGVGKGNGANRRIADGLGGWSHTGRESIPAPLLAHPGLFSLPSNDVVPGQREAAETCVCSSLEIMSLSRDTFSEFGVNCP